MPENEFLDVRVPIHWAGQIRDTPKGRVFLCGGCQQPNGCIGDGACRRANPEDFER
jgi:hypothetical protein